MNEFKHCEFCGYETENPKVEFHEVKPWGHEKVDKGKETLSMCDFCYCNTGARQERYFQTVNVLTYMQFAQGMNWLNEQLSGGYYDPKRKKPIDGEG